MNKHISNIREKAGRHKTLIQNFSYLSALQVFNMLLPLITYPYLIRVLGKETYGLVVFAQAIIGYLVILVGFGFNISATKEVSVHRENKEKLSEIVSSVFIIKGLLFLAAIIILSIVLYFIPQAKGYEPLFYLTMWMCLYELIFPVWYFQGIEQMRYITYITLVSRLTFLGLIFVFIHDPSDYLFIPIINGIGALLAGITSLYIIVFKHKIRFKKQSVDILIYYLKDSIPIFISGLSSKLYVSTNKIVIGIFLSMSDVAYYDLAEKIVNVLKIPQQIISQAIFPKISKSKNIVHAKVFLYISLAINLIFYFAILIAGRDFILILGSSKLISAFEILQILGLTLPFIAISNILGVQLLIPFSYNKEFTRIIVFSGMLYLLLLAIILLLNALTIKNISIIIVINELFVAIGMTYYCRKFKLI